MTVSSPTSLTSLASLAVTFAAAIAVPPPAAAQAPPTARAELVDSAGNPVGEVVLRETPFEGVILDLRVRGLTPGPHGFHIHETGRCDAPSFSSAGGHYAPRGNAHGALHPHGMHGGDMLNIHAPEDGRVRTERRAPGVTLRPDAPGTLFDADGSAIVVHGGSDDYQSQPSGDAGPRVACGVIRLP